MGHVQLNPQLLSLIGHKVPTGGFKIVPTVRLRERGYHIPKYSYASLRAVELLNLVSNEAERELYKGIFDLHDSFRHIKWFQWVSNGPAPFVVFALGDTSLCLELPELEITNFTIGDFLNEVEAVRSVRQSSFSLQDVGEEHVLVLELTNKEIVRIRETGVLLPKFMRKGKFKGIQIVGFGFLFWKHKGMQVYEFAYYSQREI